MLRIYGDNILECWRLLQYGIPSGQNYLGSGPHNLLEPTLRVLDKQFQLLPSPDLIPREIRDRLSSHKLSLRENPDAIIAKEDNILATFEFCSALPAGNNAWQRHGRALSLCLNGIKHFHVAKVGGYELDKDRNKKATRLPNPLLIISYIGMSNISKEGKSYFVPIVNEDTSDSLESLLLACDCKSLMSHAVQSLFFESSNLDEVGEKIFAANLSLVSAVSKPEMTDSSFSREEWSTLAQNVCDGSSAPLDEIMQMRKVNWKKSAPSNRSKSGQALQHYMEKNFQSLGDSKIPICLARRRDLPSFQNFLDSLYGEGVVNMNLANLSSDLLITCDSGFKPRGDDSRPARGLTPFARSLINKDSDTKILVFLYGPCKEYQWRDVKSGRIDKLAASNGLWESIYNMADFLILDSEKHPHPLALEISK